MKRLFKFLLHFMAIAFLLMLPFLVAGILLDIIALDIPSSILLIAGSFMLLAAMMASPLVFLTGLIVVFEKSAQVIADEARATDRRKRKEDVFIPIHEPLQVARQRLTQQPDSDDDDHYTLRELLQHKNTRKNNQKHR